MDKAWIRMQYTLLFSALVLISVTAGAAAAQYEYVGFYNDPHHNFMVEPNCPEITYFDTYTNATPPVVQPAQPTSNPSKAIRVIGLDAVSWQILNAFLGKDEMPNLKRLLQSSSYAVLKTDVANSPVSWTTIATGKDRLKHGIREDMIQSSLLYSPDAVKVPRIWDMMRHFGINSEIGRYFFVDRPFVFSQSFIDQRDDLMQDIKKTGYGFFITILEAPDFCQHSGLSQYLIQETELGKFFTIQEPWRKWAQILAKELKLTFHGIDSLIADLLRIYPDDTLLFVSDHGMRMRPAFLRISFKQPDILLLKDSKKEKTSDTTIRIEPGLELTIREEEYKSVYALNNQSGEQMSLRFFVPHLQLKDLTGDNDALMQQATEELLRLTVNDIPILQKSSEGSFRLNTTIITSYHEGEFNYFHSDDPQRDYFDSTLVFAAHYSHDPGIFIATGPAIKPGFVANPLKLVDITPTLLYLAGLPVGRDMDGSVAESIIRTDYLSAHPITFVDSYDELIPTKSLPHAQKTLSPEESKIYKQIGYPGIP